MKHIIVYILVLILTIISNVGTAQNNTFTIDIIATQHSPSVVNVFDSLTYEQLTKIELSLTNLSGLPTSDKVKIVLACKKTSGSIKANKPDNYQLEYDLDIDYKSFNSINLCVFDIDEIDGCSKKNKKAFRNFSIAPTRKKHRETWGVYEYSFIVYSFKNKNGTDDSNTSATSKIVAMSKPFYIVSERRKKQRIKNDGSFSNSDSKF